MNGALPDVERFDVPGADIRLYHHAIRDADRVFGKILNNTPWQQQEITVFNRTMPMPRLTCWMGDAAYTYSNLHNRPAPLTAPVIEVSDRITALTGGSFNGVLLNLYRDGRDSMSWHTDNEASLGAHPLIASVNLGATRRMRFKPRKGKPGAFFGIDLSHASVLVMGGATQDNWLHAITKTQRRVSPRINLTFRSVFREPDA